MRDKPHNIINPLAFRINRTETYKSIYMEGAFGEKKNQWSFLVGPPPFHTDQKRSL